MHIDTQAVRHWLGHNTWAYILGLFITSRLLYMGFGVASIDALGRYMPSNYASLNTTISTHKNIQMWYLWDSMHYSNVAQSYNLSLSKLLPTNERDGKFQYHILSWFPLYPLAGRVVHEATSISIPFSLLIVSNVSFLVALYFLYRLVRIDRSEQFARMSIAIFFLLPTSFIFSSALSEGLFLMLAVLTMYFARKGYWLRAGLMGMLLALTRSIGFVICIPLAIEALQQYGLPSKINWRVFIRPLLACILAVSGIIMFMLYCWIRTGNALAYIDGQYVFWNVKFHNPLAYIWSTILQLKTLVVLAEIILMITLRKVIRPSLVAYGILFALSAVSIGIYSSMSNLRYLAVLFPVSIGLGVLAEKPKWSPYVWVTLGIVHGSLFILWVNWWTVYIV